MAESKSQLKRVTTQRGPRFKLRIEAHATDAQGEVQDNGYEIQPLLGQAHQVYADFNIARSRAEIEHAWWQLKLPTFFILVNVYDAQDETLTQPVFTIYKDSMNSIERVGPQMGLPEWWPEHYRDAFDYMATFSMPGKPK